MTIFKCIDNSFEECENLSQALLRTGAGPAGSQKNLAPKHKEELSGVE